MKRLTYSAMIVTSAALGALWSCGNDGDSNGNGSQAGSGGSGNGAGAGGRSGSGNNGGAAGATGGTGGGSGGSAGSAPQAVFKCDSAPALKLTPVVEGLQDPVLAISPPGDPRLFIVQQPGIISIWNGTALTEFLDINDLVRSQGDEQGLLGLAFHPDFATNKLFYVNYTQSTTDDSDGDTVIAEFKVSAADPNVADPASIRRLLTIGQPQENHNGGMLEFGPDGFLYIGMGDGGSADDEGPGHADIGNGQSLDTLLGKMLRIDVNGRTVNDAYSIPSGNMTGAGVLPEIYAYGLRNPWRFSIDAPTSTIYIADVGQLTLEEINASPLGQSGLNYGWRVMEGNGCFNPPTGCEMNGMTLPIHQYDHADRCSITGGFVYRGTKIPALGGAYLYADYCSGEVFALVNANGTATERCNLTSNIDPDNTLGNVTSFGRDSSGELYITMRFPGGQGPTPRTEGKVFRIDPE